MSEHVPTSTAGASDTTAGAAAAAARLLSRPPPADYLASWARSLTRTLFDGDRREERAAVVFRLGDDLYALDVAHVREVHRLRRVHRVPGRSNEIFRGLVSLRGELSLCADVHALLGSERPARELPSARIVRALHEGQAWAFEVDELLDVRRYDVGQVSQPQVTVAKAAVHFTDGLLPFGERHAAHLAPERFFGGLLRSLS